jgi:hypothetical protein
MKIAGMEVMLQTLVAQLAEIYDLYGLDPMKPLVVDTSIPGSRRAGASIVQSITKAGNVTTVTRE